jgi:hypothetical protein
LISPPLPAFSFPWLEYAGRIPEEVIFEFLSAIDNFTASVAYIESPLAAEFIVYLVPIARRPIASRPLDKDLERRSAKKSMRTQEKEQKATFHLFLQRIDLRRREKNSTTNSMRRDYFLAVVFQ